MSASPPMEAPAVWLCASDHRQLTAAAVRAMLYAPRIAAALLQEVDRARIAPDDALPEGEARLGSWVEFQVEGQDEIRRVQLTLARADPDQLSALSPTGAALIGLREGDVIRWVDRVGSADRIRLLKVEAQASLGA